MPPTTIQQLADELKAQHGPCYRRIFVRYDDDGKKQAAHERNNLSQEQIANAVQFLSARNAQNLNFGWSTFFCIQPFLWLPATEFRCQLTRQR